jgi:hypothetical protein
MINQTTFARWRAAAGQWAQFMKPALLVTAAADILPEPPQVPALSWLIPASDRALVIDLPAEEAVGYGVALAQMNWAVIPMFNTTSGTAEVKPTAALIRTLRAASSALSPKTSGPPAFLIDSQRQMLGRRALADGDFDNRWYVFASDFPSEPFLIANGVKRISVITRQRTIDSDLRDALAAFREIERDLVDAGTGARRPFPPTRPRPIRLIAAWARGIERNPDGTFGRRHPVTHG